MTKVKLYLFRIIICALILILIFIIPLCYKNINHYNYDMSSEEASQLESELFLTYDEQLDMILNEIAANFLEIQYVPDLDKDYIEKNISELKSYKTWLLNICNDYPEIYRDDIIEMLDVEMSEVDYILRKYYGDIEYIETWENRSKEYPVATQIWSSMKEQGWNDYVCAGIMGNIMTECGGQTLNIQWWLYDARGAHYGICQWNLYYRPEASGLSLENQLKLLYNTIESEINYAGNRYYSGFSYDSFLQMDNCREAALAFAKTYERCGSASYGIRQTNAEIAYEYFAK